MQVSVEKTSELSVKMTVSLPASVVEQKMAARLQALIGKVKLDGFRPGKVPLQVVKKHFGKQVRAEVNEELLKSSYPEAIQQQEIMPASMPSINFIDDTEGMTYIATFEIYPDVDLSKLNNMPVNRPVAAIEETDVDAMIEKLRLMQQTWHLVERPIQQNDRIGLSFSVTSEDGSYNSGRIDKDQNGNDFTVLVGSNSMIPGFEDKLLGLAVGDHAEFSLTFPEDYPNDAVAGKPAQFQVDIIKVEEPSPLPEITEEFIQAYGLAEGGTVETFRDDVKEHMQRELDNALKTQFKEAVMAAAYQTLQLPIPVALIDDEINNLARPYLEQAKKQNVNMDEFKLPREIFEETAKTRVGLSMILREIIAKHDLQPDKAKVREAVDRMAQSFERPDEVVEYYYADEKRLNDIKQMVVEDQTVEWLAERAAVTDQPSSFTEIMAKQQR